jgi:glycosyltransferase involved in cell wall biosynthesis
VISNSEIFVVIPAYNERGVLGNTVSELAEYGYSIVVVDDGSTIPERQFLPSTVGSSLWYLRHVSNLGAGAAVETGTKFALRQGAQIVVHFDADGQHIPALIERLVTPIREGRADVVMGSRFLEAADRALVPPKKRLLLKLGVVVSWLFTGVWLTDTHIGFRALSRTAAERVCLTENGYAHCTEILELIRKSGARYIEVPTTVRYTTYSVAKGQSMLNSVNIVLDLVLRKLFR